MRRLREDDHISAAGAGTASVAVLPGETTTLELSMRR